jgi:hypothetical protein
MEVTVNFVLRLIYLLYITPEHTEKEAVWIPQPDGKI